MFLPIREANVRFRENIRSREGVKKLAQLFTSTPPFVIDKPNKIFRSSPSRGKFLNLINLLAGSFAIRLPSTANE
jgi:hypothetical protein